MDSDTDWGMVDSDQDSILDIQELNDIEYDLPTVAPPSLESILWDLESEDGSDNLSLQSMQFVPHKPKSMLHHCILQGISSQVLSAGERAKAGLPTTITNSFLYICVGMSHGYVLTFDTNQKLCWCSHDSETADQGAISALAFNNDSTRLLIGYERGYISMLDASNGDIIRRLPDAHAPHSAVLYLRFTTSPNLALCGDSAGCVFTLSFNRRLGVRVWESKCLFSGARGEVCSFEPLVLRPEIQLMGPHILIAMATLSKVIVISIKPRLKVLYSHTLPREPKNLPLLSWQLVSVGKNLQPVLAWGRGSELNYTRVCTPLGLHRIHLSQLRNVKLSYNLVAIHWLGPRHLAVIDTSETLRLIDVRTQKELETVDITSAGLVYGSAHFKALAIGGGVSGAFALAGERACYNSLSSRGDQLIVLGTKSVHVIRLRTWSERLQYLSEQGRWTEALQLAGDEGMHRDNSTNALLQDYLLNVNNLSDRDSLLAAVNCCIKLQKIDFLCSELWESVSTDEHYKECFFNLLCEHIINGNVKSLSPGVTQGLVAHLADANILDKLQMILISLEITCLDLHQVLSVCRKENLYDAWIHITTQAVRDYTAPLTELLPDLTVQNHKLGNTILVYVSACLAGMAYPQGTVPISEVARVKYDVLRCLESIHSVCPKENELPYPYLRALLKYNTRECLNVIEIAFTEPEFNGEMGRMQKQRLVQILLQVVKPPDFQDRQVIILACFISRLITTDSLNADQVILDTVIASLTDMVGPLSNRDHTEREQAWLDLLVTDKIKHLDTNELLSMALGAKCFRIAKHLYETKRDYGQIVRCFLREQTGNAEVFGYILRYVDVPERKIQEQFVKCFSEIVQVDSKKTAEVVLEHYPELLQDLVLTTLSDGGGDNDAQYEFIKQVVAIEAKVPAAVAERYLELMCIRGEDQRTVEQFVRTGTCRGDEALRIVRAHDQHLAAAHLLEQGGDWSGALELLLQHDAADDAMSVCIRGAEHLDGAAAQALWLKLLKHPLSSKPLRQLLHAAAPHVPPAQLIELVSDAQLGDLKSLVQGMLTDYSHDSQMLSTTFKILGRDLHQGLAKALFTNGRGVSITTTTCSLCQKNLTKDQNEMVVVWGCGHSFHECCMQINKGSPCPCPQCRLLATPLSLLTPSSTSTEQKIAIKFRPDLEGHF